MEREPGLHCMGGAAPAERASLPIGWAGYELLRIVRRDCLPDIAQELRALIRWLEKLAWERALEQCAGRLVEAEAVYRRAIERDGARSAAIRELSRLSLFDFVTYYFAKPGAQHGT